MSDQHLGAVVLRPYQTNLMNDIRQAMLSHKRIAVRLQQGGGKSYLIADMASRSVRNGHRVLILSHRTQITAQNNNRLKQAGLDPQIIVPAVDYIDPSKPCNVAMSQTLERRLDKNMGVEELVRSCAVILIDEGHLQHIDWVFEYAHPDAFIIGFSGTWARQGKQKQLGLLYDVIVPGIPASTLIEQGYIVPAVCWGFDAPDLTGVEWNYHSGDWNQRQLALRFRSRQRYGGIIKEWQRLTPNTKTLVYTTSSTHCVELCEEFVKNGVRAQYLLSKTMPDETLHMTDDRRVVLDNFENGDTMVLVNVDILGVGYDNPNIETVILDIATESYPNYSQKAARGGRPRPGKKSYTLLDFGENVQKFGTPEDDRGQSLWHNEKKGGGVASTKECPDCGALIHLSYRLCPFCGYKFLTDREIYEIELSKIADQVTQPDEWVTPDRESLQSYVARQILAGKNTNWILMNVCIKNQHAMKKSFMEAIEIMRTTHNKPISPKYWYFFKKHILKNKIKK